MTGITWFNRSRGQQAEQLAETYLKQQGLTLLERNYSCRHGEIDRIMFDNRTLVFVEVRYRKSCDYGHASETVDHKKQTRLLKTAQQFLQQQTRYQQRDCRFDVISMHGTLENPQIDWIKQAFTA